MVERQGEANKKPPRIEIISGDRVNISNPIMGAQDVEAMTGLRGYNLLSAFRVRTRRSDNGRAHLLRSFVVLQARVSGTPALHEALVNRLRHGPWEEQETGQPGTVAVTDDESLRQLMNYNNLPDEGFFGESPIPPSYQIAYLAARSVMHRIAVGTKVDKFGFGWGFNPAQDTLVQPEHVIVDLSPNNEVGLWVPGTAQAEVTYQPTIIGP